MLFDTFAGGQAGAYDAKNSLRFNGTNSYCNRAVVASDRRTWTWSAWVKISKFGAISTLFGVGNGTATTGWGAIRFTAGDAIQVVSTSDNVTNQYNWATTAVFRDPAAWYHIVVVSDTPNAVANDRIRVYVNGVRQSGAYAVTPGQNFQGMWNYNKPHQLGVVNSSALTQYHDGYMTEVNFVDGQALNPDAFGYTDSVTGQWRPKKYEGTYGTNGFYLPFTDGASTASLGFDKSGNGNDWTLTNFIRGAGVTDCWMTDTPSNNFATLNVVNSSGTQSNGALTHSSAASTTNSRSTIGVSGGKWYWETTAGTTNCVAGLCNDLLLTTQYPLTVATAWCYAGVNGNKYNGSAVAYGATWTTNDVIGVAFDADAGTLEFFKNNVSQGVAFSGLPAATYCPLACASTASSITEHLNFGQRSFAYTPPAGFKALCTANLPLPLIAQPADHFDIALADGASIKAASEGLFTANILEWIKSRAAANNHQLLDSVRGLSAVLRSNTTDVETTYAAPTGNSVGWVWKAGAAPVSGAGTGAISAVTYSANPLAGISVVGFTTAGGVGTITHGLGVVPDLIFLKGRTAVGSNWSLWANPILATQSLFLNLDSVATTVTSWNNTAPTSSVFTFNSAGTGGHVAYCFANVEGFSKVGEYTGNGNVNGPFVYCGFRPKYLLVKAISVTSNWWVRDAARETDNVVNDILYPNLNATEVANSIANVDFLSNGFKVRADATANGSNVNNARYLFVAFAEYPFNYANAR